MRTTLCGGGERRLSAVQKHLNSVRLLIVDELGYVPFAVVGAELFFDVLSQRYERGAALTLRPLWPQCLRLSL